MKLTLEIRQKTYGHEWKIRNEKPMNNEDISDKMF